jgi:hypothetical protein
MGRCYLAHYVLFFPLALPSKSHGNLMVSITLLVFSAFELSHNRSNCGIPATPTDYEELHLHLIDLNDLMDRTDNHVVLTKIFFDLAQSLTHGRNLLCDLS